MHDAEWQHTGIQRLLILADLTEHGHIVKDNREFILNVMNMGQGKD